MKTTKTDEAESEDDLEEEYKVTRNHRHEWHVGNLCRLLLSRDCLSVIRAFCFYYYAALYKDEGNPIPII